MMVIEDSAEGCTHPTLRIPVSASIAWACTRGPVGESSWIRTLPRGAGLCRGVPRGLVGVLVGLSISEARGGLWQTPPCLGPRVSYVKCLWAGG